MDQGELTLANQLSPPAQSITLFDRAYFSADFLIGWQTRGESSHWLMRAKDNLRYDIIKRNSPHDFSYQDANISKSQKNLIQH